MIDLWGVGYEIASRMGLEKNTDFKLLNGNGKVECSLPLGVWLEGKYISIQRSELARLISEALPLDPSTNYDVEIVAQTKLESWTKSGIALIGDAAVTPSFLAGEGVGLGLTGAYVLAHKLNTCTGHLDHALKEYEDEVKPFVSKKQDAATGIEFLFAPENRIQLWLGNLISKLLSIDFIARLSLQPFIGCDYQLPEYK